MLRQSFHTNISFYYTHEYKQHAQHVPELKVPKTEQTNVMFGIKVSEEKENIKEIIYCLIEQKNLREKKGWVH